MLIYNIGRIYGTHPADTLCLRGREMDTFPYLENAWLHIRDTKFSALGAGTVPEQLLRDPETIDARGAWLFPAFCDSHTHIIYAGSREGEFRDKIDGLSYEEIARRGGGILNSADRLHLASEDDLFRAAMSRVREMIANGTGAIEIKSGYGLRTADELKMLRVARRIQEATDATIRATFLGAHAVGREYIGRQAEYVDLVCREMIPAVAAEGLADFVDVFCDKGFFTPDETARILDAAARFGIRPKIHANELDISGGVQVGVSRHALSVDHLERIGQEEIDLLAQNPTCATMLPGASFFLGMPYGPARQAIDSGCVVALASDYNPGSSPSGSMRMVVSLGCIKMKLTPERAFNAATLNGAYAMGASHAVGSIAPGREANFFLTDPLPDLAYFPYAYTSPLIRAVYLRSRPQ